VDSRGKAPRCVHKFIRASAIDFKKSISK